ncbi:GNAT family N-acetyltransferase [Paenibacillus sp. OV219]|uniref:GNAT family N-acetyltransferase n=1 Tax=Paenibacillus sp. OV219 TaxID=1884377 RepID=UPI001160D82C|nr:hypothetical protein [Paenibacillus sp. OV219]
MTARNVYLREFVAADLDVLHSLAWQPEIYDYLPGWNVPKEQWTDWFVNSEMPENAEFLKAVSDGGGDVGELRLRIEINQKETEELIGWCCIGGKSAGKAKRGVVITLH